MHEPRFLIHPGYPKCGSTTLQLKVLKKHSEINFLSGHFREGNKKESETAAKFYQDIIFGGAPSEELDTIFSAGIAPFIDETKLNVISDERLLFGYRSPFDIIKDLSRLVPQGNVLIVVRSHVEILRSYYDMYPFLLSDPDRTYVSFSVWLRRTLSSTEDGLAVSLRFVDVVQSYRNAFQGSNIVVVSLERLFNDTAAMHQVCGQFGLDATEYETLIKLNAAEAHSFKKNAAEAHSFKKHARRLLGPVHASWFLSYGQIQAIGRIMNRFLPKRRTVPDASDLAFIAEVFKGQTIKDLKVVDGEAFLL